MPQFHETVMGSRFIEGTVPRIAKTLERIADSLDEMLKPDPEPQTDMLPRAIELLKVAKHLMPEGMPAELAEEFKYLLGE